MHACCRLFIIFTLQLKIKYIKILLLSLLAGILTCEAQTKSFTLITDAERDLIPEGIAVHDTTIYISSINKHLIVATDKHGKSKNFISSDQDGYAEGLGMKVDKKRSLLWAVSTLKDSSGFTNHLHAFDLATGLTKQHYKLHDTVPHLFNDLDLDAQGTVYITDTYYSAVYRLNPREKKLELFLKSPYLNYPNGLALGRRDKLYIATYDNGLMQLDLQTKKLKSLKGYTDSTIVHGLDGLVYWKNTLIGIYNNSDDRTTNAVVQYFLDATGENIIHEQLLDKGNPAFYEPTTAALSGDTLFLLANSHLALYNANKTTTKGIEAKLLSPIVIQYNLSE